MTPFQKSEPPECSKCGMKHFGGDSIGDGCIEYLKRYNDDLNQQVAFLLGLTEDMLIHGKKDALRRMKLFERKHKYPVKATPPKRNKK